MKLILASKSPRRREILENLGFEFEIITAETDESCSEKDPCRYVEQLALRKGMAVYRMMQERGLVTEDTIILAADTVVAVENDILGKPCDTADAERMLRLLSGRTHRVISGIALLSCQKQVCDSEVTGVRFAPLSDEDVALYVASDEPYDKAGAYAIQGRASLWISHMEGSYSSVIGLPLHLVRSLLIRAGYPWFC